MDSNMRLRAGVAGAVHTVCSFVDQPSRQAAGNRTATLLFCM